MKRINFALMCVAIALVVASAMVGAIYTTSSFICIILAGIAGSVIATSITNWLMTRRLEHLPITSIVNALEDRTKFARKNQELRLEFKKSGSNIIVTATHGFQLINPSFFPKRRLISIFTDGTRWSECDESGGFTMVREPGGMLQGTELKKFLRVVNGKQCFQHDYKLPPGDGLAFEFHIKEFYRLRDRLVWTIQDLSRDLTITIVNHTGFKSPFVIKLHHHRESDILNRMVTNSIDHNSSEETTIEFDCDVLPYQGFEMMWDFECIDPSGAVLEITDSP